MTGRGVFTSNSESNITNCKTSCKNNTTLITCDPAIFLAASVGSKNFDDSCHYLLRHYIPRHLNCWTYCRILPCVVKNWRMTSSPSVARACWQRSPCLRGILGRRAHCECWFFRGYSIGRPLMTITHIWQSEDWQSGSFSNVNNFVERIRKFWSHKLG